jgi:hypothetical protein
MPKPSFRKTVVATVENAVGKSTMNTFSAVGDVNGDGRPDIVISGRNGRMVWLENPGAARGDWKVHLVAQVHAQECGGSLWPLCGPGGLDIINGGDGSEKTIQWWQNPRGSGDWIMRTIAQTPHTQFHDTAIGDVTGDGRPSLVFTNQQGPQGTSIYRVPLPAEPRQSPWPGLELIAEGRSEPNEHRKSGLQGEEGLAIGDIDGDGRNEVVCGTHWYKRISGAWRAHKFTSGMITTKVAIGDIDGDGRNEIVLAEGDPCVYGKMQGGKLAWYKPAADIASPWTQHVLADGLLDAHSLQLADLCGNGRLGILLGEVGVADRATDDYVVRPPRLMVLENLGGGRFQTHVIDEGTGTHEAVLADMLGRGVLDIVGKPLHGSEKWNIHVWFRQP